MSVPTTTSWDYNKENIIPVVSGRPANYVTRPLESSSIQKVKMEFESSLRRETHNKFKLLDIWFEYVTWFEQVNLTGRDIKDHIERALTELDQSSEIFELDKYVKLWLKYASFQDQKEEIFKYLVSSGIGFSNSVLYTTYAYFCEVSKDFQRAEEIYNLGFQRMAKPRSDLEHAEFLSRASARADQVVSRPETQTRAAFTDILLTTGKVAVDRVSHLTKPEATELIPPRSISSVSGSHVRAQLIHEDHSSWNHPLIKSKAEKDNIMPATKWEGVKLPVAKLPSPAKDGISVHKVFQDKDSLKFNKNRCHLLYPSSIPIPNENGQTSTWIVATEMENRDQLNEYSMEELMSLRYYHLKYNEITYPLKYQLIERLRSVSERLQFFIHF